jgi:SAM-dependent methyltransferase
MRGSGRASRRSPRTLELVIDHLDPLHHVGRYLLDRGVTVAGLDLSAALVACARQLNPTISFKQGDCRRIPALDHTLAGIVAFYSFIHLPRQEVTPTLVEWRRAVKVGGLLLLAVHLGEDALHLEEWWGHRVSLDFAYILANATPA